MSKRARSGRLSQAQVEYFVRYVEKHPELAKGRPKTCDGNQRTRAQWRELTRKLNAIEGGVVRSSKAWAKYWADKKCSLKKATVKQNRHHHNSNDGNNFPHSALDVRLINVLNREEYDNEKSEDNVPVTKQENVTDSDELSSLPSPASSASHTIPDNEDLHEEKVKAEQLRYPRRKSNWTKSPDQPQCLQTEWNRLAAMEERRVEAECMAAKAQQESSVAMCRCAAAIEALAGAVKSQGTELAEALRANGQVLAEALQTQGKLIADALQNR